MKTVIVIFLVLILASCNGKNDAPLKSIRWGKLFQFPAQGRIDFNVPMLYARLRNEAGVKACVSGRSEQLFLKV